MASIQCQATHWPLSMLSMLNSELRNGEESSTATNAMVAILNVLQWFDSFCKVVVKHQSLQVKELRLHDQSLSNSQRLSQHAVKTFTSVIGCNSSAFGILEWGVRAISKNWHYCSKQRELELIVSCNLTPFLKSLKCVVALGANEFFWRRLS